jgi:hypothetical protein
LIHYNHKFSFPKNSDKVHLTDPPPAFSGHMSSDGPTLVLGASYAIFHTYFRQADPDIVGFVYCRPGEPPFRQLKGLSSSPLHIYASHELESVINDLRIAKCEIHIQSVPMLTVESLTYRVLATGRCQVLFRRGIVSIKAFKPVIVFSALARNVGKGQSVRYFCSLLHQHGRKVSVIIPLSDVRQYPPSGCERVLDVDRGPHFEYGSNDGHIELVLSPQLRWSVSQYQLCGAHRIYVTTNVRRAIIQSEQQADIILYDGLDCEESPVDWSAAMCAQFCGCDYFSLADPPQYSLWPGLVNLLSARNVILMCNREDEHFGHPEGLFSRLFVRKPEVFSSWILTVVPDQRTKVVRAVSESNAVDALPRDCVGRTVSPMDIEPARDTAPDLEPAPNALRVSVEHVRPVYVASMGQDEGGRLRGWLLAHVHRRPALQSHFESQVDIIMAMSHASDRELYVTNNDSANREAFCRLFLASHLPPGFRVTTGEIIDSLGNKSGQLDVVIVTDLCPRMTIDATNAVIAPILADNVLGVVEVKTSMTPDTLRKALGQVRPVKALMPQHSTLASSDGRVVSDPLEGKIVTGIFAFNLVEMSDPEISAVIAQYPGVADFIVLPSSFGYFAAETLRVCGFAVNEAEVRNGYVRYSARGMGLAVIFGILNVLAATRRFSGSNCVSYLNGQWRKSEDSVWQDAAHALRRAKQHVPQGAPKALTDEYHKRHDEFFKVLQEMQKTAAGSAGRSPEFGGPRRK